jgi:hypothetical protein
MVLEASAAYANYPSLSLVTGSTDRLTVTSDGKVGIGTTSPVNNFQVTSASTGTIGLSGAAGTVRDYIFQTAGVSKWALRTDGTAESGANAGSDFNIVGRDDAGALLGTYLYIKRSNGNIGIGTTNPYTYKLAINGSAIATAMWVKNFANWPDYVFKTDYKLPALNDLKTYIDKNHHLPDVPTEKEVKQNGLNLGEMNKVLVKKVEELTLYMIDKDRQLAAQQAEINDMKRQMEAIEKKLANK